MVANICPPDHKHAENATCWGNHACRCAACREGQRLRVDRRRRLIAYGRWDGDVDVASARRHIGVLVAGGWPLEHIAKSAGVGRHTVTRIRSGESRHVRASTAEKILAVRHESRPPRLDNALVDATGTIRRLQALVYMGWSGAELMRRLGSNPAYISRVMSMPLVFESTRRRVTELFEEIWDQDPPAHTSVDRMLVQKAMRRARNAGWVGPLAWDDIDDPESIADVDGTATLTPEEIHEALVDSALAGEKPELTAAARHDVVIILNDRRWSGPQIAEFVGCSVKTVERDRKQLNLPIYLSSKTHRKDEAA